MPAISHYFKTKSWEPLKLSLLRNRERLIGGVCFIFALWVGYWAHQSSEASALRKFEKQFLPSEQVFTFSMQSYGMRKMQDARVLQKLLPRLPDFSEERGGMGSSRGGEWVFFNAKGEDDLQVQIYCSSCSTLPDQWERMGNGWRGLEEVVTQLQKKPLVKVSSQVRKKAEFRDPRAIVY